MQWTGLWVVLVVLVTARPVQAQTPPPQTNDRSVVISGQPRMSLATFQQVLEDANSPAAIDAEAMYNLGKDIGIEPSFLLAVFKHESSFATDPNWAGWKDEARISSTHNIGNIRCTPGYDCYDGWRDYPNWVDGARDLYGLLSYYYIEQNGLDTVREILYRYAPPNENDTEGYIRTVLADMQRWEQGDPATSGEVVEEASLITPDYWVWAPAQGMMYELMRYGSMFLWQINKAVFVGDENVRSVHDSLTSGFEDIIEVVGRSVGASSGGVAVLGLTVAGLLLVCIPFFEQRVVSVHRALLALFVVPFLLPSAGITFRYAEDIRQAAGAWVTTEVGGTAARIFSFDYPAIPGTASMSRLERYYGQPEADPIDVAAAYMWAMRTDVVSDIALPTEFERTYFTAEAHFAQHANDDVPVGTWSEAPIEQRNAFLQLALTGLTRASTGVVITTLALLNRVLQLLFTAGLGISIMGLIFVLPFMVVDVFAASSIELLRQLPRLIVASWGLTALQAIALALLFVLARAGSPWGVFITSILDAILTAGLVWIIGMMVVRNGLMVVSAGATGGFEAAQDAGRAALAGVAGVVGGAVAGGRMLQKMDQAVGKRPFTAQAEKFRDIATAHMAASEAGHSPAFAQGYAMSGSRRGRALARASLASGMFGGKNAEEMERGLRSGVIAGKEDPSSLRSILLMRQAPKQPRVSPGRAAGARYVQSASPQRPSPPSNGPGLPPPPSNGPALTGPPQPRLPGPAQPLLTDGARVYTAPPSLPGPAALPITIDVTPQPVVAPAMSLRRQTVPQRAAARALARQRRSAQLVPRDRDPHKQEG